MTGCGCLLLVALLGILFYVFTFGSTDAGEPIAQITAFAVVLYWLARKERPGPMAGVRTSDARRA